jgi:undecaprenyl phosphate-alpha-L-ara4N flippase subunit ArnE
MSLLKWIPLFLLDAASESTMQIFLKKGAEENRTVYGIKYYLSLLINKWVILGILVYVIDMVIWLVLLANIPLSVAFPLTGTQKIFIIFFSAFILKETVSFIEWVGIGFIIVGLTTIVAFE